MPEYLNILGIHISFVHNLEFMCGNERKWKSFDFVSSILGRYVRVWIVIACLTME